MTYRELHRWVEKQLGKPMRCANCFDSSERRYHWANLSGEYKKDTSDWKRLCVPCHKKYDLDRLEASGNRVVKKYCKQGHLRNEENTKWRTSAKGTWRICKQCQKTYILKYHKLRTEKLKWQNDHSALS